MGKIRNIARYISHYGSKSALGLIWEKLFIDPKRFSPVKKRLLPKIPQEYKKAELPPLNDGACKKPITVMYLIHYFYPKKKGGTERFTLNLAKEMKSGGNRPLVLVLEANEQKSLYAEQFGGNILYRTYEYEGIECIGFRHRKAPLGLYYKSIRIDDGDMRAFAGFLIKEYSVDIVHAAYPQPFASFLDFCGLQGVPYLVTCTDFAMMCHYSTLVDKRGDFCISSEGGERCSGVCKSYGCRDFAKRKACAERILRGAEIVTVPSEFVANMLGGEFKDIEFLPIAHGISRVFKYEARRGRVKRFVYAGTLSALKGVHLLIDAFESLREDGLRLDIFGEGDENYVSSLKSRAGCRVNFHGAVGEDMMPEVFAAADCVVVPSMWYETYNFVLREAIMTGALVIAADIGAMPEAIDVGENGFLFAVGDKASLTETMKEAIKFDFSRYRRREYPSNADEANVYLDIYNRCIKRNK